MSKPWIHAQSSAKKFGGKPEDYIEIHNFLDSSKGAIADNRHRSITHQSWFLSTVLERIKFSNSKETSPCYFTVITNSDNKDVSVRDIGEQHILEDFRGRFIPTAQDYLQEMDFKDWMQNGNGYPPSSEKLMPKKKVAGPVLDPADLVLDGSREFLEEKMKPAKPVQPIVDPNWWENPIKDKLVD